jgi:predicted membrane protein
MSVSTPGRSNALVGSILIGLGILFLLGNFELVGIGELIVTWWPLILIAIAVYNLLAPGGRRSLGPYILLAVGILFLGIQLDFFTWRIFGYLWPIILILIGLRVIFGARIFRSTATRAGSTDENTIVATAIFGGSETAITSQQFAGGQATALFGGIDLDLRQARLDPGGAVLNVTALFGGVEIIVPPGWHVVTRGTPILGSLENKAAAGQRRPGPQPGQGPLPQQAPGQERDLRPEAGPLPGQGRIGDYGPAQQAGPQPQQTAIFTVEAFVCCGGVEIRA